MPTRWRGCGGDLWIVNTLFSCLCTLDGVHNFVPRWKPRFVSAIAAEDRCHLNGLGLIGGRPAYVTALGETDAKEGWRPGKASGGCLIDVASGVPVVRGLSMPHSPRPHDGGVLLLESGRGRMVRADPADGSVEPVAEVPGYARGLSFVGGYAFVGLSKFRKSSSVATFGGLPISERTTPLSCGVSVVELASRREVARLEFHAGIDEIFDVQPLPDRHPWFSGPHPKTDDVRPIWVVPEPEGAVAPARLRSIEPAEIADRGRDPRWRRRRRPNVKLRVRLDPSHRSGQNAADLRPAKGAGRSIGPIRPGPFPGDGSTRGRLHDR